MDGVFQEYYENGILRSVASYKDEDIIGTFKVYYESGKLKEANTKIDSEKEISRKYYESGEIAHIDTFKNGQHINRKSYNKLGELKFQKDWPYKENK